MTAERIIVGGKYRGGDGNTRVVHAIVGTAKLLCPFFVCYQQGFSAPKCMSIDNFADWAVRRVDIAPPTTQQGEEHA